LIAHHPGLRRGVLYIEDFDDPPPAAAFSSGEDHLDIVTPSFSAEEIAAAREEGLAEGYRRGQQAALEEAGCATRLLLEKLAESLAASHQELAEQADEIADELARGLFAAVCGSLPALCRAHGEAEMRELIRMVMPGLAREAELEIRVHADLVEIVRHELAQLPQELPKKLAVVASAKLEHSDIHAVWNAGHLVRSSRQIWQDVRSKLALFDFLPIDSQEQNDGA